MLDWTEWIGKENVFIRTTFGTIFSDSKVIDGDDKRLKILDRDRKPVTIRTDCIVIIKQEEKRYESGY